jgi:hypothetical protein
LRTRNEAQIGELIRNGTPGGMPAFKLPEGKLQALARWLHSLNISAFDTRPTEDVIRRTSCAIFIRRSGPTWNRATTSAMSGRTNSIWVKNQISRRCTPIQNATRRA